MGTLWPRSNSYEWDANGERAEGALIYFFEAGTSTPRTVYQDAALSTPHEHPVEADGLGRWPAIFLDFGDYKERATTAAGSQLWTTDSIPNPAPFDDTFELDTTTILNTGDMFFSLKNGTRTGAVRLNGRTIGSAASSATERANADTADLFAHLWDNLANGQAAVSGGRGATAAADFAANKTITLPSARGAALLGLDDMGNTAASLLGSAPVVSGGPTTAGSVLGANTHTLLTAETPAHTHSFSATTGAAGTHTHSFSATSGEGGDHTHTGTTSTQSPGHHHSYTTATGFNGTFTGPGGAGWSGTTTATSGAEDANHTHTFNTDASGTHTHSVSGTTGSIADHTHSVSGTTGSVGSDGAHNNVQRSLLVTWFIKL